MALSSRKGEFLSRSLALFTDLARLPSPSFDERRVAERVRGELERIGLAVDEDGTGPVVGSTAGNLYARLPGSSEGTPLVLCAHLDTVPAAEPVEPVVGEDGIVRSAGDTILGADNKAAVAVMVEAARRLVDERRPHAGVELVFTTAEEVGLRGALAFDADRLHGRLGYVYDVAGPIGDVVLGAPSAVALSARFHGRAAHAGIAPEEGRSAIAAAARAIADLRLGRLDETTTANVGVVRGGTARNVVAEWCELEAEARSHDERSLGDLVQEMLETLGFAAALADCTLETEVEQTYRAYRHRRDDLPVRLAAAALERAGYTPRYALTGGAADANVFNERGIPFVNLANGSMLIHTPDEHIAAADLDAMVEVTLGLVDAARDAA